MPSTIETSTGEGTTHSVAFASAPGRRSEGKRRSGELPVRPSEEFDRRYDGPFARPVKNVTGDTLRRSQSQNRPSTSRSARDAALVVQEPATDLDSVARETAFLAEPPRLNYTLRTRKLSIFLWWTVIIIDSVAMPIGLYFGLWYGVGPGAPKERRKLSANAVFSIVTAAIGGASILEYFLRMWSLWKKDSDCRVIAGGRWHLDWFHWNFTLAWLIVMVELIVGSVQENPYIRLIAMAPTTMLFVFGTELLIVDTMRFFHLPAPVRISSIPGGAQLRPGIYSLVEDICAVDGGGGTAFREALDRRYEASHVFRTMLRRLGIFWAVGAEGMAVLCTILIFTVEVDYAYAIGWSVPFVWAGVWTLITIWYVKIELRRENREWARDAASKPSA
ncbi:Uncharacterized protein SAPIO_CDS8075 [Scedosporium apiospermum]|uniref:Uncharacterized protein n=1 Tax=Pseudallescheria apiosperma TaxID=563466 RepID=A0A084G0C8_PSEDA|nr:Uncharacterized protein SAPIO_CDS8075 [Scedosporium apiospermum]KEZ40790.1 Uncharacterized protein SAPIO_CDS8075 [Scedosporium apiospermum]